MTVTGPAAPEIDEHQFLELRTVNVARGDRIVLHDVNLTIRAGEHVAILGPNGCGKSTLILHHDLPDLSHRRSRTCACASSAASAGT